MFEDAKPKRQPLWRYTNDKKPFVAKTLKELLIHTTPRTPEEATALLQDVCDQTLTRKMPKNKRAGKMWWSKKIEELRKTFLSAKRRLTRQNKLTAGSPDEETFKVFREAYLAFKEEKDRAKNRLHYNLCEELNSNPWGDAKKLSVHRRSSDMARAQEMTEYLA